MHGGRLSPEVSHYFWCFHAILIDWSQVLSLVGVLLIARPPFLFGGSNDKITEASQIGETTADSVTPNQRLIAVGYVLSLPNTPALYHYTLIG